MREYSIYVIRNKVNDKVYIGQTSQSVKERFNQHKKPSTIKKRGSYKIYNAMQKYGIENFYVETLETGISENDIDAKECEYIEKFDSFRNGYNSTPGGDSKTISRIEDVEIFKKQYMQKVELKDMAKYFNVDKATIRRTADALGLPKRTEKVTKEFLLKNQHKTNIEMAKELGVSAATISRGFRKFGIERGKGCSNKLNEQNKSVLRKDEVFLFWSLWCDKTNSAESIAKQFGVTTTQLCVWAKKLGFPKRRYI